MRTFLKLNIFDWYIVLLLFFSTIFNSVFVYIRLFLVGFIFITPFILFLLFHYKFKIKSSYFFYINISFAWIFHSVICIVLNSNTFLLKFDGPSVELLTPLLMISFVFMLAISEHLNLDKRYLISSIFIKLLTIFLTFEMIWRYFQESDCFLNYNCRFEAKTVGFFTTTNSLATSLILVLISISTKNISKWGIWYFILCFILISTMGRAAIISYIFTLTLIIYKNLNFISKFLYFILMILFSYYFIYFDPFELINDGSGQSKVNFFLSGYDLLSHSSYKNLLFGWGSSFETITSVLDVNDWSPHSPVLKSLLYYGIVGVILYIIHVYSFYKIDRKLFYPILGYLICSFAGVPIYLPTMFVAYFLTSSSK